jgi:hypothetical protein
MIDNPILNKWLKDNNVEKVAPITLLPVGILMAIYDYGTKNNSKVYDIVDKDDLRTYMKYNKISELTSQSLLPFAVVMGPNIFKEYV